MYVKDKEGNPESELRPPLHLGVVAIKKESHRSLLTAVTNFNHGLIPN